MWEITEHQFRVGEALGESGKVRGSSEGNKKD